MKQKIKDYIRNNKHILFILYLPFYGLWFMLLENWTGRDFTILHCKLDDMIPLVPIFVIPYFLWFAFVTFFCIYFFLKMPKSDAIKMYAALEISMTFTLFLYTIWPNAVSLRYEELEVTGFSTYILSWLWNFDTDTNVCPSLHVLNTLTILVAYFHSGQFKGKHLQNIFVTVLSVLICLSTLFLKQHSVIDLVAAVVLCILNSMFIYLPNWGKILRLTKKKSERQ